MSRSNRVPNFICPGAQKAATTTLHDTLVQHPEVFLPAEKEAHFFDLDEHYERGLDWYLDEHFSGVEDEPIVGEVTPRYMYYRWVPERIFETLGGEVNFVFMLRDPVARAYSQYWMHRGHASEKLAFEAAVDRELQRRAELDSAEVRRLERAGEIRGYVARGRYTEQIEQFLKYYPMEQMLFVRFSVFVSSTERVSAEIFDFLGLGRRDEIAFDKKSNPAQAFRFPSLKNALRSEPVKAVVRRIVPSRELRQRLSDWVDSLNKARIEKPEMDPAVEARLREYYRPQIERLEELTDMDLSEWYRPKRESGDLDV